MSNLVQRVAEYAQDSFLVSVMKDNFKGLGLFISDIRRCKSRASEVKRVNKELTNIKTKFKASQALDSYQRKKYIAKLCYIYLLGYPVEFGDEEAFILIASTKYSEKSLGYMFLSFTFDINEKDKNTDLLITAIKNDLRSTIHSSILLALRMCSNLCVPKFTRALFSDVCNILKIAYQNDIRILNSATSCLLAMIRSQKDLAFSSSEDIITIINLFKNKPNISLSSINLLEELLICRPESYQLALIYIFELVEKLIAKNIEVYAAGVTDPDYYYQVYSPWVFVKAIRILNLFNYDEPLIRKRIMQIFDEILYFIEKPIPMNKSHYLYSYFSIVFEFSSLCINLEFGERYLGQCVHIFVSALKYDDLNLKGLALENLGNVLESRGGRRLISNCFNGVLAVLKAGINSEIRKIAFEVCYSICDQNYILDSLPIMIDYISCCPVSLRHDASLKIAILAEKYASSYKWYIDQMINLIRVGGEHLNENVWFRVVKVITANQQIQAYACLSIFKFLRIMEINESTIKLGAYIIGEFGQLISDKEVSSPSEQFLILLNFFPFVSNSVKYIIISAFGKMAHLYPELSNKIKKFLQHESLLCNIDPELQQRTVETLMICNSIKIDLLKCLFERMPQYTENIDFPDNQVQQIPPEFCVADHSLESREYLTNSLKTIYPSEFDDPFKDTFRNSSDIIPIKPNLDHFVFENDGILFSTSILEVEASVGCWSKRTFCCMISLKITNKAPNHISDILAEPFNNSPLTSSISVSFSPYQQGATTNQGLILVSASLLTISSIQTSVEFLLKFKYQGNLITYSSSLPLYTHHFILPVSLSPEAFLKSWQSPSLLCKESGHTWNSRKVFNRISVIKLINALHFEITSGVDQSPFNIFAAGGMFLAEERVGILIRLEINQFVNEFRLIVRSTDVTFSQKMSNEIAKHLER